MGKVQPVPNWTKRDPLRARALRRAATPAERHLWRYLSNSQIGFKFSRQMQIGSFFADFLCRERKLIIELDGFSHDVAPERDVFRDRYLHDEGYRVLHFPNREVLANVEGVVNLGRSALGDRPTPDPSRKREGGH